MSSIRRRDALGSAFAFSLTVVLLILAMLFTAVIFKNDGAGNDLPALHEDGRTVVIDAGHGGIDGGAVALDGTLEKEINLEISKVLAALMRASGYEVVMTRSNDEMLGGGGTGGSSKMRDLKYRLETASRNPEAITVSIHCNKFPLESCKGMQVYYSDNAVAKDAAGSIKEAFLKIDPSNKREIKKSDSSIYLLYRATSPTVLVECGFLSNNGELEKLKSSEYQKKLALVIMSGLDIAYENNGL